MDVDLVDLLLACPRQSRMDETYSNFFPFGDTPALNVFKNLDVSEPFEDDGTGVNVLFLGCGDLKNPLATAIGAKHNQFLHIHINDISLPIIARNILILKITSGPEFDPTKEEDMDYVWHLWYDATWPQTTLKRFLKDVKDLLDEPLPYNIFIPESSIYLERLKVIWTEWLSVLMKNSSIEDFLAERSKTFKTTWTYLKQASCVVKNLPLSKDLTFSEAIDLAVSLLVPTLINDFSEKDDSALLYRMNKLKPEIVQYFKTGNCGQVNSKAACINPTFLHPITEQWYVHHEACPFCSFLPLPRNEMDAKNIKHGIITDYCRSELKKLLTAFRTRMEKVMFYLHPCDALVFCYGDLPYKFDIIDTSNLADTLGLANLLNAASRKLLSDRSLLFTESTHWPRFAPSVAEYLQEMLLCPLSLIPTLYGFRLLDNVKWGQEIPRYSRTMFSMPSRLRWKKAKPFGGVPLVLTPPLKKTLQRLMNSCSISPASFSKTALESIRRFFSPLTFFYVLSDLIRRGSIQQASSLTSFLSTLRPVFRKSFETCRAWMENRPVWRVNVSMAVFECQKKLYDDATLKLLECSTVLRLVLIPTNEFQAIASSFSAEGIAKLTDLNATDNHFIESFAFTQTMNSSVEFAGITFLLEDRSLLETHAGIVIKDIDGLPAFSIGPLSLCIDKVQPFTLPYPWLCGSLLSHPTAAVSTGSRKPQLIGESCQETEDVFTIRFKLLSGQSSQPFSGLKVTGNDELQRWPCRSTHQLTVSLDNVTPLTVTLPFPILLDTIKTNLNQKDGIIEVVAAKALNDLLPEDIIPNQFRWNAENLERCTDFDAVARHLNSQFRQSFLCQLNKDFPLREADGLTRIRTLISAIFSGAAKEKKPLIALHMKGPPETKEWLLRAHLPVRTTPLGAPVLLLSALDQRQVANQQTTQGQGKLKRILCDGDMSKKFTTFFLNAEDLQLFRYILRLNSTKIQPTPWQKKNLPRGGDSPWLSTFIVPLYLDGEYYDQDTIKPAGSCSNCGKLNDQMKRCGRCHIAPYCSVECQRAHWPHHKLSCSKS